MSDTECSTLDELRRALGDQLRTWRQKARLSQAQLARRVGYSRSSVASAETGDHQPAEDLWARCDEMLGAGGSIAAAYRELAAHRDRQARERARRAEAERDAKIQQWREEACLEPEGGARAAASVPTGPPAPAADVVLVPYLTVAGTVEYVRMSRRAFVATGGLAAAMVAAGAAATDEVDRLVGGLEDPRRADWQVVRQFRQMLAVQKANEYVVHPALRVGPVVQQISVLDRLGRNARTGVGSALRSVQAEYAEYVGWLHQEIGNQDSSVYWTDTAIVLAHAGGDFQMVSFATSRKVNIASWEGRCREAVNLAEQARRVPWHVPPGLASLNSMHAAHALARLGEEADARRLLEEAAELITHRQRSGEDAIWWARHHTNQRLRGHHALCHVELGRLADAVAILDDLLPGEGPRDGWHAGPLSTLALAHARAGDARASAAAGEEALDLTDSACTLMVLHAASRELDMWEHEDFVRRFRGRLDERRRLLRHSANSE
jgi:transcriptional regulator with XRE-family HTH domain